MNQSKQQTLHTATKIQNVNIYYELLQTANSVRIHTATKTQNVNIYYKLVQTAKSVRIHTPNIQLAEVIIRSANCLE